MSLAVSMVLDMTCLGFVGCPKAKAPTAEDQAEIACGTDGSTMRYLLHGITTRRNNSE